MPPLINLIRHAEAIHDIVGVPGVKRTSRIHDPVLSWDGELEAQQLAKTKIDHLRPHVTHVIASPSLCTIHTAIIAFDKTIKNRLQRVPTVLLNAQFMESLKTGRKRKQDYGRVRVYNCNKPCPLEEIRVRPGPLVDISLLETQGEYINREPQSSYKSRPREARQWLRKLAQEYGEGAEIAVVSHGTFLQRLIGKKQDECQSNQRKGLGWSRNADVCVCKFAASPPPEQRIPTYISTHSM